MKVTIFLIIPESLTNYNLNLVLVHYLRELFNYTPSFSIDFSSRKQVDDVMLETLIMPLEDRLLRDKKCCMILEEVEKDFFSLHYIYDYLIFDRIKKYYNLLNGKDIIKVSLDLDRP